MRSRRNILVNSTILFVVAAIVEMTLHEFSHFFAAILVQAREISIHHNYVSHSDEGLSLAKQGMDQRGRTIGEFVHRYGVSVCLLHARKAEYVISIQPTHVSLRIYRLFGISDDRSDVYRW